jgi:DNA polymerase V
LSLLATDDYDRLALEIRQRILQWTGVPTSVGVGSSKTLAKAASEYAKKHPETGGAFSAITNTAKVLDWLPVADVWGIGFRWAPRLEKLGIKTAQDFANLGPGWVRKQMSVTGLRTWKELNGESCVPLSSGIYVDEHEQKTMTTTRLFGKKIRDQYQMELAVANHASRLSAKLRRHHQIAWQMIVYVQTYKKPYKSISFKIRFPYPTSDTAQIVSLAVKGLGQLYDKDQTYRRVGLIMTDLAPETAEQTAFFDAPTDEQATKMKAVNKSIDDLNGRFGPKTVKFASQGVSSGQEWQSKRKNKSPAYTTNWQEIPKVKPK